MCPTLNTHNAIKFQYCYMNKSEILAHFSKEPDRHYAVHLFSDLGFERRACSRCGRFFWTLDPERDMCPDDGPDTYSFIGNPPTDKRFDYAESWRQMESFFVSMNHVSTPRYPVVCRWRDDLYYTIASIVDFQRVAGSKITFEFPANPLVVPQPCLRFKDIDNVGVSGRHFSSFCMVGQHSIPDTGGYWKDQCIQLDYDLLTRIFGIFPKEITFVEDVWAGGGSFGPSLEYFVCGLELGNAVFTEFQGTLDNYSPLDRRVIDMGAGLERFAWITMGTPTAYDCCFGPVLQEMITSCGVDPKPDALKSYYTAVAKSLDTIRDINQLRKHAIEVAGLSEQTLKSMILPLESVYMVADHIRTLIFAICDGSLPSNVGGGYNLRMMLRRVAGSLGPMNIHNIVDSHIDYLSGTYKELDARRQDVHDILDIELARYAASKTRMSGISDRIRNQRTPPTVSQLITLYESDGITPDYLVEMGAMEQVPAEFYPRLAELHQKQRPKHIDTPNLDNMPDTVPLYYEEDPTTFTSSVLKSGEDTVILDRTSFYPRGGGQEPDTGTIEMCPVVDVQKHGNVIVHYIRGKAPEIGDTVRCSIDRTRRDRITSNHTATHILNASSRRVLGSWVWQHSAYKDEDHARLDITHHSALDKDAVSRIEREANNMIKRDLPVSVQYMDRGSAEKMYGFSIYQGGVVPVKAVRIVSIGNEDIEACGGTHVSSTGKVGQIRITRSKRIQDGVVRLEFVSGPQAANTPVMTDAPKKQEPRKSHSDAMERLLDVVPRGEGSEYGAVFGGGSCVVYHDEYDQKFHTKMGKRLIKGDTHLTYCGIFHSGPAIRVMVYCGSQSLHSAIHIAQVISDILGGRAVGDNFFAQGGGRKDTHVEQAVSWARSELIP